MPDPVQSKFLPVIDDALREHWDQSLAKAPAELRCMIAYHMGWENPGRNNPAPGKRIRPMLLLLVVDACGKDWVNALPAAVAVEYLHNFSLIHDDIQDRSKTRHGGDALWVRWGIPQAINAGDLMFTMAFLALVSASSFYADAIITQMTATFSQACLKLTEGQYLDMHFEEQELVTESEYLTMIKGKTATLLGCCVKLGAILGTLPLREQDLLEQFGVDLGLAFQIQDDILGIWGDQAKIGKSVHSDIVSGKKTLPIIHARASSPEFSSAWKTDHTSATAVNGLMELFKTTGSYTYAKTKVDVYTKSALSALHKVFQHDPPASQKLELLVGRLMDRDI
jgi:geranylgeranyl diphosphate synthase type I